MASIPKKPPLRGNFQNPRSSGNSWQSWSNAIDKEALAEHRDSMEPVFRDAIRACEEIRRFLLSYSDPFDGVRYSFDLDVFYRDVRKRAIAPLVLSRQDHANALLDSALPPALNDVPVHGDISWHPGWIGDRDVVDYQSFLVSVADELGIPLSEALAPQPAVPVPSGAASAIDAVAAVEDETRTPLALPAHSPQATRPENPTTTRAGQPTRATRKKEERQSKALALREDGQTVKAIALQLRVAERTVYTWFEDPKGHD